MVGYTRSYKDMIIHYTIRDGRISHVDNDYALVVRHIVQAETLDYLSERGTKREGDAVSAPIETGDIVEFHMPVKPPSRYLACVALCIYTPEGLNPIWKARQLELVFDERRATL